MIAKRQPHRKLQFREGWESQFLKVNHSECGGCSDATETLAIVARKGFHQLIIPRLYPISVVTVANPKYTGGKH